MSRSIEKPMSEKATYGLKGAETTMKPLIVGAAPEQRRIAAGTLAHKPHEESHPGTRGCHRGHDRQAGGRSVAGADPKLGLVQLSAVAPERVKYLWPGRIPRGKLTIIIGDPGEGKSYLTLDIAARVSTGQAWPDGGQAPRGNVVLFSAEDGLADTIRPRIDRLGGDPSKVFVLDRNETLSLKADRSKLQAALVEKQAALVIIDPLSAYLGHRIDSNIDAEVRTLLTPIAAMAEQYRIAIIAVMHLTKNVERHLIYRAPGSIGFVGQARAVFVVARDPQEHELPRDQQRRLFVPVKFNLGPHPRPLAFRIDAKRLSLTWERGVPLMDLEKLVRGGADSNGNHRELGRAEEFLHERLKDGPVLATECTKKAREQGIPLATIMRAKTQLGINSRRLDGVKGEGADLWELPPKVISAGNVRLATPGQSAESHGGPVS